MVKKIAWVLLIGLIIIQFIHPPKNESAGAQANYIGNVFPVPDNVKSILAFACNDCHSNNTRYPWYGYMQPVDWWLTSHIREGKRKLNLDEFTHRPLRYQYHKLEEIEEMVKENEMPLTSYTWIHKDARLSAVEKTTLIDWSLALRESMKAKYPIDSLIRKNNQVNPAK